MTVAVSKHKLPGTLSEGSSEGTAGTRAPRGAASIFLSGVSQLGDSGTEG